MYEKPWLCDARDRFLPVGTQNLSFDINIAMASFFLNRLNNSLSKVMRRIFSLLIILCLLLPATSLSASAKREEAALKVIERVTQRTGLSDKIILKKKRTKQGTYFRHQSADGVLHITASDNVALCRGFYDYMKQHRLGLLSWSGSSLRVPEAFADEDAREVTSPFANHYYFNVCTYGYSMPYWDWERWEQEIDWMALHGINMPLALVAYEAIMARVWEKMGLTREEINAYFAAPAHLPWMRMGNISSIDGPLNDDWHKQQIALQHKILQRMRELDMKPICPGFPGFVPQAFKRLHPELELIETNWAGGAFHNWMVSPQEPLFREIGTVFIREWEKEFGRCDYYLADSFNEMEIPFPEKGNPERYALAASYGEHVYESIRAANPRAVWVMQGWMFGYQRNIWDYDTLEALVSRVPDDKMLLLDLAVDYNKHFWHSEVNWEYYKGFYGKPWVYSVIPNMGGKTGLTGVLDFYANGHLEALASPNRGRLVAHGMAPEGIENNEVIYELVTDAGWCDHRTDVRQWLRQYAENRYGQAPATLMQAWEHLLASVYGTFTDHPRFNWQFRPGSVKRGSINLCEDYFEGLQCFADAADELGDNPLYRVDLQEMAAQYVGGKAEILTRQIDEAYLLGDTLQARFLQSRFETLLRGIDLLLSQHPTMRLDRWLDFAHRAAATDAQRRQYDRNARRILTIWGPPVDDYAARMWSGLVGDYYLPRWLHHFESRTSGRPFDMAAWERQWVEDNQDPVRPKPAIDIVPFARRLMRLAEDVTEADLKLNRPGMIGVWSLAAGQERTLRLNLTARMLEKLEGISCEQLRGDGEVQVSGFELEADGEIVASSTQAQAVSPGHPATYAIRLPKDTKANNGCTLTIRFTVSGGEAAGIVETIGN